MNRNPLQEGTYSADTIPKAGEWCVSRRIGSLSLKRIQGVGGGEPLLDRNKDRVCDGTGIEDSVRSDPINRKQMIYLVCTLIFVALVLPALALIVPEPSEPAQSGGIDKSSLTVHAPISINHNSHFSVPGRPR